MEEYDNTGALLKMAAAGDMAAFEQLITGYEKMILSQAYHMLGNAWDARDAAQETLVKIYRNIHKCSDPRMFRSWVRTITNNTCIDELRRRRKRREESLSRVYETDDGGEKVWQFESNEDGPEKTLLSAEKREAIAKAIDKLPPKYKALIVLRDINGLSYEELSEAVGLTMGTVKSRLSRARAKLQKLLAGEY